MLLLRVINGEKMKMGRSLCSDKYKRVTIVVKVPGREFFVVVVSISLGLVLNEGNRNDLSVMR